MKPSDTYLGKQITMSKAETGCVYVLKDPRTDEPKYVGATVDVRDRLSQHKSNPTSEQMRRWIQSLLDDGLEPNVEVVATAPVDELRERERKAVNDLAEKWELINADKHVPYSNPPQALGEDVRIAERDGSESITYSTPLTDRGQVTVPKPIRNRLGVEAGSGTLTVTVTYPPLNEHE